MRLILGTFVAAAIGVSVPLAPAAAQAQAGISIGMQVVDPAGATVGSVSALKGDNLVLKTDKHEVQLPKTSFRVDQGKLLFGMTQAQLNAEIEKSLTAAGASVVAGATVNGIGGTPVGKIDAIADGKATIALTAGQKIQVPQDALRGNPDGTVTIGYTSAQLQDLVEKATTPAAAPASGTAKSGDQ
jgi:hypothetical protein